MSADVDLRALGATVTRGIAALISRTVAMQFVVLGGTVALTRLLGPREFGVFAIVQSTVELLAVFGTTGVGAALVRQPEEPSERQLSSIFYLQLGVSLIFFAAMAAVAGLLPWIWHDLPDSAPLLLRVMAIDFVLVCLSITPLLLMERRLEFKKLAAIEVVGSITFYGAAVSFAAAGLGVWALVGGVLVRGIVSTMVVFSWSSWRPRALFGWATVRPLLRFGIAQQSRSVIGLINGAVIPFYGGRTLGVTAVGYINWAQNTAYFPLKLVDILSRVGFPVFARLQHDRVLLGEALGRTIQLSAFFTFGWIVLCLGLGEHITAFVFSSKWLPAVPLLIVFASAIGIGFLTPLVAVAFDAVGRPGFVAKVSIVWTALNWIVVPIVTARWHTTLGFALGYAVHVVVGNIIIAMVLRRFLPESKLWLRVRAPLAAAAVAAAVTRLIVAPLVAGPLALALSIAGAIGLYIALVWLLDGRALRRAMTVVPDALGTREAILAPALEGV